MLWQLDELLGGGSGTLSERLVVSIHAGGDGGKRDIADLGEMQ